MSTTTDPVTRTGATQGDLWSEHVEAWADGMERFMEPTFAAGLDALGVTAGTRLLDVGCGAGLALSLAAGRGAEITGLDAAPAMVAYARRRLPGARIEQGDLE
jgi:cyclopropane fatty-acyl-phospholipid synthase-like methyltransferase